MGFSGRKIAMQTGCSVLHFYGFVHKGLPIMAKLLPLTHESFRK